jgi:hypothetical protein
MSSLWKVSAIARVFFYEENKKGKESQKKRVRI